MNLALKHKDPQVKPAVFEHGIPHALCCGSFGFSGYRNEGGTRLHVALKHKDPQVKPAVFASRGARSE